MVMTVNYCGTSAHVASECEVSTKYARDPSVNYTKSSWTRTYVGIGQCIGAIATIGELSVPSFVNASASP